MHDHPKGKSSCHCLNAIWMKIFVAATAQRRGKHVNNHIVKQSAICIGNEIQMQKNQEGQRVENRVLPARNTETKLPLRQERAPSSECGQVTESPRSPHHLDAQGHGNNGQYVRVLFSISQCVSQVLNHSILLYCWTIKPTAWWTSLKNNDAPMLHACSKTAILSLSNIPFRFIYLYSPYFVLQCDTTYLWKCCMYPFHSMEECRCQSPELEHHWPEKSNIWFWKKWTSWESRMEANACREIQSMCHL